MTTTLTQLDFTTSLDYLSFVWSLMVLNYPYESFYNSVLQQEFIDKLIAERPDKQLPIAVKMKLLNINAGVELFIQGYRGAMLLPHRHKSIFDITLKHSKEKQQLVNGIIEAIKGLVPKNCLKLNQDTSMGFVVDAEFFVDDKGNPIPRETTNGGRIAVMVHDFHNMCRGPQQNLNGITTLSLRLLSKAGYKVISVPYNEQNMIEKLTTRIRDLKKTR